MELALIGLALIVIVVFVIPLAILRAGIRRQHCAACDKQPPVSLLAPLVARAVLVQKTGHFHFYFIGYVLLNAARASLVISSAGLK